MSRLTQLQRLHDADPGDADVMYMLAQEHAKAGETAEAVAWFDRCLAANAGYCYAYFHKARALEDAGRVVEAAATLRAGLEAARRTSDAKAAAEIGVYLDQIGG